MDRSDELEGYPDSPHDELVPPAPPVPLDAADRELAAEGEVELEGQAPADDSPPDDRLADSPDADQLAAIELGGAGARPEDRPNFNDNQAEWSRERS